MHEKNKGHVKINWICHLTSEGIKNQEVEVKISPFLFYRVGFFFLCVRGFGVGGCLVPDPDITILVDWV